MRSGSMIRSGSRVVNGSRFVGGCWFVVDWSRNIGSGFVDNGSNIGSGLVDGFGSGVIGSGFGVVRFIMGLTLICYISDVSMLMISSISDNLGSTIREGNTVFSGDYTIIILSFLFGKISTRVFVFDSIFISKWSMGIKIIFLKKINESWF